jgi:tetratricopeptide (TPR) repeat protein
VHRLVQTELAAEWSPGERERWATHAGHALAAAFPGIPDNQNWHPCERLVPHVLACPDHLDRLGVEFKELGRLVSLVAVYLRQRARQRESEPWRERACAMLERAAGDDEMQLAWSLHNLGILNHDLGRPSRAEALCRRAHEIAERQLDSNDQRLTWFLNSLARVMRTERRYADAEDLLKRGMRIWKAAESADAAEVVWPQPGLGDLYLDSGRPELAEAVLREAVDALADEGRCDHALPLLREALAIAEAALGPTHNIVGIIIARYADALGDDSAAGPLRERAAAIKRAR